ncbi:MAG: HAD-IA family hydrolase [Pseudomonadota bacterium]
MSRRAILFDLDGTLLDTAPDMVHALQRLLAEHDCSPCDYAFARAHVSRGAAGLVEAGFGQAPDVDVETLRTRFLTLYAERLCVQSALFEGCAELLDRIEATADLVWGIVTNKPTWLAEPLLEALALKTRAATLVCGDTLPRRKPHPDPLLHAAAHVEVAPSRCLYAGDDLRDIHAAHAAAMPVIAAAWGYIAPGEDPVDWRADAVLPSPADLTDWLGARGWFHGA